MPENPAIAHFYAVSCMNRMSAQSSTVYRSHIVGQGFAVKSARLVFSVSDNTLPPISFLERCNNLGLS